MLLSHSKRKCLRGVTTGCTVWLHSLGDRKLLVTDKDLIRCFAVVALRVVSGAAKENVALAAAATICTGIRNEGPSARRRIRGAIASACNEGRTRDDVVVNT